jgi:hypothetical protein
LESWLKNDLSLVKSVQFFVEPTNQRDLILAIIDDFALKCPVPVIVHKNKEVLGVLKNPWHLFENCFSEQMASRVILGEDDFVVAPDTLRFLLSMTTHMDNKTMAVCAKWVGKNADHNPETWHRSTEFTGNIWMMPRHIWKDYVRDTWDFDYSSGNADGTSCVPYSTTILTKNGWTSVKDLRVGDETIGFNRKTQKAEWTLIEDIVEHGYAALYSFGTKGLQFTSTSDHRWIVSNGSDIDMIHTCNLSHSHKILTSAALENTSSLNCSVDEAAVLGWIAGDGSFLILEKGALNAKVNQKKKQNIIILDDLFSRIPHTRKVYKDVVQWRLPTSYARDLLSRVGNPKKDAFSQVLKMNTAQREAWINAMLLAEGSQHGSSYRIYQNRGCIEEATRFAIFASGRRPQTHILTGKPQWKECVAINSSKPIVSRGEKIFVGSAPVWCVKTKLGTWTARQGDQVFLTGNSGWDHNIGLRVIPRNGLHCIVPTASRSRHIGVDGVHCHKDVFDETVAWNAINTPYSRPYTPFEYCIVRPTKTYSGVKHVTSSGDLGDIIVSLATLHHLGCEAVYLLRDNGQTKGITSKIDIIKPILMAQPYIKDVKIYEGEHVDWQSEGFRSGWVQRDMSLAHNHAKHALDHGFISTMPNLSERWLFNIEPSKLTRGRVVINRSPRYGNPHFPWRKIVEFYGEKLLFLGLDHEHRAFCDAFGAVEYKHTANMLEAAELIAGSKLFIGNQSSCMTIAEGMKHPRIQEGSLVISDCVYPNAHNAQYVFDGSVNLPCLSDDTVYHIDSQVKTWRSYLVNEVPICGNGIIGWHYQCGNVMVNEGYFEFAVRKVKKLTGWDDETASKAIVEFTVSLNPQWFEKKVRLPQLDVARRALRNAGYNQHAIL